MIGENKMTEQEKIFADKFVFLRFNNGDVATLAQNAAMTAGYNIPNGVTEADKFCKELLNNVEISLYIAEQLKIFNDKFSERNRRKLWAAIAEIKL